MTWEEIARGGKDEEKDTAPTGRGIEAVLCLLSEIDLGDTDADATAMRAMRTAEEGTLRGIDEAMAHTLGRTASHRHLSAMKTARGAIDIGCHLITQYRRTDHALDLPNQAEVISASKVVIEMVTTVPDNTIPLAKPRGGRKHLRLLTPAQNSRQDMNQIPSKTSSDHYHIRKTVDAVRTSPFALADEAPTNRT